jgi:chromosome segregation ATPase
MKDVLFFMKDVLFFMKDVLFFIKDVSSFMKKMFFLRRKNRALMEELPLCGNSSSVLRFAQTPCTVGSFTDMQGALPFMRENRALMRGKVVLMRKNGALARGRGRNFSFLFVFPVCFFVCLLGHGHVQGALAFYRFFAYSGMMDERTKSILAIERKIADETARIDGGLRELGRLLLERSGDGGIADARTARDRINEESARLETAVRQIDRDAERVNEIDNGIADEERQNSEARRQLAGIYPNLGRLVTEDAFFATFSAPYRERIDALRLKIDGLDRLLAGMDGKGNAPIFAWLGRSARSLAAKSRLAKARAARERVYAEAGAAFLCSDSRPNGGQTGSAEGEALYAAAGALKRECDERAARIAALKEEKQEIGGAFGHDGNANRKRAEIRRRIDQLNRERDDLCLRLGRKAEDLAVNRMPEHPLDHEMTGILEDVARCRETVKDYEDQTARLQVSIEIDEERAEVERLLRLIAVQRQRIAAAEEIIAQHGKHIAEANKRIADLLRR